MMDITAMLARSHIAQSQTQTQPQPQQPTPSASAEQFDLWQRIKLLPRELEDEIFEQAGLLTEQLHGRLPLPLTKTQAAIVAAECFQLDAVALVPLLAPEHLVTWDAALVRSTAMKLAAREHLCLGNGVSLYFEDACDGLCEMSRSLEWTVPKVDPSAYPYMNAAIETMLNALFIIPDGDEKTIALRYILCIAATTGNTGAGELILPMLTNIVILHNDSDEEDDMAEDGDHDNSLWTLAFHVAIEEGHYDFAELTLERGHRELISLATALQNSSLEMARAVFARYPSKIRTVKSSDLELVFAKDNMELVRWLLEVTPENHRHRIFEFLRDYCLAYGKDDLLEYAVQHNIGEPAWVNAMDICAEEGLLDRLIWLHNNRKEGCSVEAIDGAARNGHIDVVKFLIANRTEGCSHRAFSYAGERGNIEMFCLLWDAFPKLRPKATDIKLAASEGSIWIIEFFLEHTPVERRGVDLLLEYALVGCRLFIADWLVEKYGATPKASMMESIATDCRTESARWLHRHVGGGYSPRTVMLASETGCIDTVKFLVEECRVDIPLSAIRNVTPLEIAKCMYNARPNKDWNGIALTMEPSRTRNWLISNSISRNPSTLIEPWSSYIGEEDDATDQDDWTDDDDDEYEYEYDDDEDEDEDEYGNRIGYFDDDGYFDEDGFRNVYDHLDYDEDFDDSDENTDPDDPVSHESDYE